MKKFFAFIIKQSVAIVLIVAFVLGFGVWSTVNMDINLLPDINVPMVCVQVIYPGANAASVEEDVTKNLEEGLGSISGITELESYSYDNLSALVMSFNYGTDTTAKKTEIQNKLASIELPSNVSTTVYDVDLNAEALAVLSVVSDEGADDAYDKAQQLSAKITALDGVENVEIKGGAEYSYTIKPFGGLELISPLIVQAFSYGSLDLPLGSITDENGDIQIRNNSDVKEYGDIENMPVELPSSLVSMLSSVKQVMGYYEDSTEEDLIKLREDLDSGVSQVLRDLSGMTAEEVDKFAELKTYMNIADSYTAEQLTTIKTSRYYNTIEKQVKDENGNPKSDEELKDLADEINEQYPNMPFKVSQDFLKVVRDGRLDDIIVYRQNLEQKEGYIQSSENNEYYELTDDDYVALAKHMGVYGEDTSDEEIKENVNFAKKTSATGLAQIADKKREEGDAYNPTDAECALLFTATELSSEHPIIMSSTFIAFVRSEHYDGNMDILISRRAELGEEISAAEFYGLYTQLNLEGVLEINLSEQLIGFILDTDLTELTAKSDGSTVLVVSTASVANVVPTAEYSSYAYYFDGKNIVKGIIIEIFKANGANSSRVVDSVKSVYAEISAEEGYSAKISLLDDQSEFISDSISNVLVSMLIGGLLAILIIFLFLKKVRTSLVIAITMPLSVLAALICLYLMGITLNMVSLGGLAVGIGMLVDNSIVVIEAISKHRDMGKTAFEAAVDGTTEVGGALFGSTLTTVCVFIPILFSGGLTAEIFTDLSFAVIFSLTFSLIVAVTVIPALYAMLEGKNRLLKGSKISQIPIGEQLTVDTVLSEEESGVQPQDTQTAEQEPEKPKKRFSFTKPYVMDKITGFYSKILPWVLGKKLITIITAVVIFGASIGLLMLTGTEFLPSIDKGQVEVTMSYGSGRELAVVQDDVLEFSKVLTENIDNIDYLSASVGKNGILALTDSGIITVQLKTNRDTYKTVDKIRQLAKEYKPLGSVTVKEIDGVVASLMSGTDDLSVTIVGDSEKLGEISEKIKEKLKEGNFEDIKDSATDTSTQYTLEFDRRAVADYGLDYQTLVLTLRIGIASYTACTVTLDGEDFNINVSFEDGAVTDKEALENFIVGFSASDGEQIKLKDVLKGGKVTEEQTEACIRRSNGKDKITVSAALPGVDTGTAGKKMQAAAKEVLREYNDYSFESSGITSYLNDAFEGLAVALVVSFFLLYAVMAIQFGSALKPLIIMASIPFSFTGGFLALVITGTSLNVVSFIGLIMLMGVVVNNAIVMLEKIKQLETEGMPHYDAVIEACKVRLRPILMTTLTTILALIPLAIGVGQGSELMQPLGIVVIGGLLIGTLVTLVLIPAVYSAVHRLSTKHPNGKKKIKT